MLWRILFLLLASGVVVFVWTQIVFPAYRGHALFPMLDTSRSRARKALKDAKENELETYLKIEAEKVKARTAQTAMRADQEISDHYDGLINEQENRK
jgi:hypothetical protein